ncbi:hypothetical protein DRJ17_00165 [Candidatus Woesearchaeota archaeon]|nr:MAG: hypothetical protein DRJ17_00165 [Candidatus Woesearchaeota archaeon]
MITQNQLTFIGIVVIFLGIIILMASSLLLPKNKESNVKVSAVGVIGFIPFGFSTDKKLFIITLSLVLALMIFTFFMFYYRIKP